MHHEGLSAAAVGETTTRAVMAYLLLSGNARADSDYPNGRTLAFMLSHYKSSSNLPPHYATYAQTLLDGYRHWAQANPCSYEAQMTDTRVLRHVERIALAYGLPVRRVINPDGTLYALQGGPYCYSSDPCKPAEYQAAVQFYGRQWLAMLPAKEQAAISDSLDPGKRSRDWLAGLRGSTEKDLLRAIIKPLFTPSGR